MNIATGLNDKLRAIVGPRGMVEEGSQRDAFLVDHLQRFRGRALAVVQPACTREVAEVVRSCVEAGIPVVPHGGNTGYCGGATPDTSGEQVMVSLARMRTIHAVDRVGYTMTVDAGCVLARLQAAAEEAGLLFPLSLGSEGSCQIGGNISSNAGGTAVLRYGNARDLVLGLEVVLPDGRIWNGLKALRKDNAGYDLKHWFIGAEGTLGIITRAVLKLFPQPHGRATALVAVADIRAVCELLAAARRHSGDAVTSFEYLPRLALDLVLDEMEDVCDPLGQGYPHYVLIELSASGADAGEMMETVLGSALESGDALDAAIASSGAQREALWRLRESVPEAQRRAGGSLKHDISLPTAVIPDFMARASAAICKVAGELPLCTYGHVGDGNLHFNLQPPAGQTLEAFKSVNGSEVSRVIHDLVHELGGSVCAEHGVGQLKTGLLESYGDPTALDLMRAMKGMLDPRGLMNPGKVLPVHRSRGTDS